MFPCPYANEHDCDEAFQSQVEASHHAILSHQVVLIHKTEDGQFICLHAEFIVLAPVFSRSSEL